MNLLQLKRSQLIDDQMMARIQKAVEFLWRLRNDLHFFTRREQDVLALPIQHQISMRLGYRDRRGRLAEEEMMREYYRHALTIRQFAEHIDRKCSPKPFWSSFKIKSKKILPDGFFIRENKIHIPNTFHFFEHYPQRLLMTFIHAARYHVDLAEETAEAVRDNLDLVDQAFLHHKETARLLREFFSMTEPIGNAIHEMRKTKMLERIFPEWRSIIFLVRYDLGASLYGRRTFTAMPLPPRTFNRRPSEICQGTQFSLGRMQAERCHSFIGSVSRYWQRT